MLPSEPPTSNARAIFLIALFLTLLGIVTVGFFVFLIGPAFLGVLAVMAGIGVCHYLLWGRSMENEVVSDPEEMEAPAAETNGWTTDGPHPPRRL
jgi:hypothetical protein